jgi:hypothetical protein
VLFSDSVSTAVRPLDRNDAINSLMSRRPSTSLRVGVVIPGYSSLSTYVDGGAGFSCINEKLARRLGLVIYAPTGASTIDYAAEHLHTRRIGKVHLPLTLHFVDCNRDTIHFFLELEVLNIPWDFLLGAEVKKVLFPDSEMANYGAEPSSISRPPTMVKHTPRDDQAISDLLAEDQKNYTEGLVGRQADSLHAILSAANVASTLSPPSSSSSSSSSSTSSSSSPSKTASSSPPTRPLSPKAVLAREL